MEHRTDYRNVPRLGVFTHGARARAGLHTCIKIKGDTVAPSEDALQEMQEMFKAVDQVGVRLQYVSRYEETIPGRERHQKR